MNEQDLRLSDAVARREVLDVTRSFIVQAPAGAGKTELLIQRYLALLAVVDAPEEIIAITFTRKAAAEMRVRVLGALASVHLDPSLLKEHRLETRRLAAAALARDESFGWKLEQHPMRMRIMTIDSMNGWLARQLPWQSGMGGQVAVSDDADELRLEAARRTLAGAGGDRQLSKKLEQLLIHLDNRYGDIESRIASLLGVRDQWLRVLGEGGRPARDVLEQALTAVVAGHLRKLLNSAPDWLLRELPGLAAHAAGQLPLTDTDGQPHPSAVLRDMTAFPGPGLSDLPVWKGIAWLLLTGTDTLRSPRGVTKNQGFPSGDVRKADFQNLLTRLAGENAFIGLLGRLRSLPNPFYGEEQWDMLGTIVDILLAAVDGLKELFSARGMVDHNEVAAAALNALGDDLNPTDLSLILEHRIGHILIDEFQDTSTGQFALLERLTGAWIAEDGHTLFLVGDPMQSIYRFREAEVGLFLRAWGERRIGSVPLTPLRLALNFRSVPGIVRWVNDAFSSLLPGTDDPDAGAVSYAASLPAVAADADGGAGTTEPAVSFRGFFNGDRSEEARFIAHQVTELLTDGSSEHGGDPRIAVLVRARHHLAPIAAALRDSGQSFRAVEIEALAETPLVRDLYALTFTLLHAGDSLSSYAVLRAPWCGASLHTLTAIAGERAEGTVIDAAERCLAAGACDAADIVRLERCLNVLRAAHTRRGRMPLRRLVEGCWLELGGPLCTDEAGVAAANAFFEVLEGCDDGGDITDLREIQRRTQSLFAPPDPQGNSDVQLMTMHKAKGLQFDSVFLPRLEATARPMQDELLLWQQRPRAGGTDFLFAPVAERGSSPDATYAWIKQSIRDKDAHERLRLLYVAATRAKQKLFLTANLRTKEKDGLVEMTSPRSGSFLYALQPLLQDILNDQFASTMASASGETVASKDASQGVQQTLYRLPAAWSLPQWPAPVKGASDAAIAGIDDELRRSPFRAGEQTRVAGIVIHALLAMLADGGVEYWERADDPTRQVIARRILRHTASIIDDEAIIGKALLAISRTLSDSRGRWILQPHVRGVQEWQLSGVQEGNVINIIIDRSFVDDDGVRWIIDYKTAMHEGAAAEEFIRRQQDLYAEQLRRYAGIAAAFDGRPVRMGLYFPMMQEWREIA